MASNVMRASRARLLLVAVLAFVAACDSMPPPSGTPAAPAPSDALPAKVVGDLEIEACDPDGLLPCERQAVTLREPVAATGLALTYSTEWADGRLDRPVWNADSLGLGGWSLDVLQRYDAERGIILAGDGSWRFAQAVDVSDGHRAVPARDGLRYFVFDPAWRHVRTVDSITGSTLLTFDYDAAGRLTAVRGQRAGSPVELNVARAPDGTLGALLGAGDTRTVTAIDGEGRLAAVGRPHGTILAVAYAGGDLVASWQDSGRGAFRYVWDAAGRAQVEIDPDGVERRLEFSAAAGSVTVTSTDALGATATFHAERRGEVIARSYTAPDGTVTGLETDAEGATTLTEADGTITTAGALAHPRWGTSAPLVTPIVEKRPDGTEHRVELESTMAGGSPEPAGGPWQATTTIDGRRYVDAYDPATRTMTTTDPTDRLTVVTFDDVARVIAQRQPGRAPRTFTYDARGFLASSVEGEGSTAATTSYAYDTALGEVTITRPDGSILKLWADAFGRLALATTADENVALGRDAAGALLQLRAGGHPATSFGRSEAGRETAFIPPVVGDDAWYELRTYTPAGRLATIGTPGGRQIDIAYDGAGRVAAWTFDRGRSSAGYGASSGLLETTVAPDGVATSLAYDGWVPTGLTWTGPVAGTVERTVDGSLRPTSETVNGDSRLDFRYDAAGLLTSIANLSVERDPASGLPLRASLGTATTTFTYDASARLLSSETSADGAALVSIRYERDLFGRVTGVSRTDSGGSQTTTFQYDGSGRLTSEIRGGVERTFAYDASGNRVSISTGGEVGSTATYDDRDRILTFGDASYRSSADGPLLEQRAPGGTTSYDVDDLGDLRAVELPDGRRIEYVLDASGRRIGRKVDGVLTDGFLYAVDDTLVAWTDGSGRVVARFGYDDAGRLALVRREGRDLLVVTDQVGSPLALVDGANGAVVAQAAYDAWGNLVAGSLADVAPFGFAGGLLDPATGLVHFAARDYDPATGRWISPDPVRYDAGDLNLYRYASGDPVNNVDRTGLATCPAAGCATSGADTASIVLAVGGRRAAGAGATGGSRTGGTTGGYHHGGPTRGHGRPVGPASNEGFPTHDDTQDPNRSTLPPEHPLPPGAFGPDDEANDAVRNCFGEGCRNIPGTDAGYCWGNCAARGGKGSGREGFTWCTGFCVYGEPHLATADGGRVDFQAAGEFVVARSTDATFEVQGRFEVSPTVRTVTRTTAVATRYGPDRVAFHADPERPLVINGQAVDRAEYATTLPGGGIVERHGSDAFVTWPDGSEVRVHSYGKFMDFTIAPSDGVAAGLVGILGGRDGDATNDLVTRGGTRLDPARPDFHELLYGEFAAGWRIADAESAFDYLAGESTATFQKPEIPTEIATLADLDAATRARAEALCRAMGVTADPILSDCVFDVGMTGDPSYAGAAAKIADALEVAAAPRLDLGAAVNREQLVSGDLVGGAVDRYHFAAQAGDIVYLDADVACGANVDWRLLRPAGGLAAFADACEDIGRVVLPEAGKWRLEVYSDDGAAGPYAFRILSAPAPRTTAVTLGQSVSGATTAVGEWHRYALEATAGQVVYLDAEAGCDSPMWWRLLRPNGAMRDFATACNDMGREVLDEAGTWVVEVYSDDLDAGAYAFRVIGAPPARESTVSVGQSIGDATSQVGEWHRYRLTAAAGDVAYLDGLGDCVDGLYWRLLRPNGGLASFATTCLDMGRVVMGEAGDWTIEVYADGLQSGAYSFRVIGVPRPREASVAIGRRVAGTVAAVGEWHRYTLSARAGQRIVIDTDSACVPELYWRLLRPDGGLTTFNTTCTDSDTRTLDVAGDWVIEVYADTLATGSYAFTVRAP